MAQALKKIPSDEVVCTKCEASNGSFYITRKRSSYEYFYLYKIKDDGGYERIGKATSPTILEDRYVKW